MRNNVDVVIPTFHPKQDLWEIIEKLEKGTMPPGKIRLINTEEEGFLSFLKERKETEKSFLEKHRNVEVYHILPEEFDHGGTRNLGMALCEDADYVVMMTQDAIPADEYLLERITYPLRSSPGVKEHGIAASYARQLARPDAKEAEKYTRLFNYPPEPMIKTEEDFSRLGIKTYFCSNVCACYRRDIFNEEGPFPEPAIFNEDMVYAGRVMKRGFAVAYVADARVIHSHDYSGLQQLRRNFDLGVSQSNFPEVFRHTASEKEGARYVKSVLAHLKQKGAYYEILPFLWGSAMRLLGFKLGRGYENLPKWLIRKLTMNPNYWAS